MTKTFATILLVPCLLGCSSTPSVAPIDNALLAQVTPAGRSSVEEARRARDTAVDAHALAKSVTQKYTEQVAVAEASVETIRSRLDETKLAIEVAEGKTPADLARATAAHDLELAKADYANELLALRKRELEVATLNENLALETERLRLATVELTKAEALQDVDLVAAQKIAIKDYRKQVTYHREEVATAQSRASTAEARTDEARGSLRDMERQLKKLESSNE